MEILQSLHDVLETGGFKKVASSVSALGQKYIYIEVLDAEEDNVVHMRGIEGR